MPPRGAQRKVQFARRTGKDWARRFPLAWQTLTRI